MEFASGASGVLSMHGHSHQEGRTIRIDGTRATLRGASSYVESGAIEIHDHLTGQIERIEVVI